MRARLKSDAPVNTLMVGDLQLGREWIHVPPDLEEAIRYWAPIFGIEVDEAAPDGAQEPSEPREVINEGPAEA